MKLRTQNINFSRQWNQKEIWFTGRPRKKFCSVNRKLKRISIRRANLEPYSYQENLEMHGFKNM